MLHRREPSPSSLEQPGRVSLQRHQAALSREADIDLMNLQRPLSGESVWKLVKFALLFLGFGFCGYLAARISLIVIFWRTAVAVALWGDRASLRCSF